MWLEFRRVLFRSRPTHIILETEPLLKEHNVKRVMVDNYRINGINITEEELANDDLYELLNQVKMLLRLETIDNSPITAEDIWFICQVDRMLKSKNGK